MKLRNIVFSVLIFFILTNLSALGSRDRDSRADNSEKSECIPIKLGDILELTGRIKIKF